MRLSLMKSYLLAAVVAVVFAGCKAGEDNTGLEYAPNMYHNVPYEPLTQITDESAGDWVGSDGDKYGEYYSSNPNNPHRMTMRVPPANTVRREKGAVRYFPLNIPKDSLELAARILKNPLPVNDQVLAEGKELYLRFCSHCHGENGVKPGKVGEKFGGVASYKSAAVKGKPEGHIFHVITHGKGRMLAHGSQISQEERWKIVRYVQKLMND